ncbi:MAG: restriction endonuclease subunit S [Paraglaciecola chathamensis]
MSWPDVAISEVCILAVDCINKTAPIVEYETPYKMLRTTNVRGGFVDVENVRYVTEETFEKWNRRATPRRGDVILTREAPLGDVGRLTSDDNVFLGQRLFLYRADEKKLDSLYLAYVLQSPVVQGRFKSKGFGATVQHAKVGDCENLLIPYPPLSIQKKIGSILSSYDDLIECNRRRVKLLEESARLLYQEWFVDLRFPGHEQVQFIDGVPEEWKDTEIGSLCSIKHGFAFKGEYFSDEETSKFLLTPGNFKVGGGLKFDKKKFYAEDGPIPEEYVLSENDLLITMTDLSKMSDTLGYPMFVPKFEGTDFLHNQRLGLVVPSIEGFPKYFFYHLFQDYRYRAYVVGSATGTSVKHTAPKKIAGFKLCIPDIHSNLITLFNEYSESIYKQISTLTVQNHKLARARDILLPKLMSGELTV